MKSKSLRPLLIVLCATLCSALVGAFSATASSTLPAPKLDDPNKTTGAVSATQVNLTWSAVTGADHYIVRRETKTYKYVPDSDGKGPLLTSDTKDIALDVRDTAYADSSFPPSDANATTYLAYKVRAVAAGGKSGSASNQVSVKIPRAAGSGPLTAPGVPSSFTSTKSPNTISFSFAPSSGGVVPLQYIVRRTGGNLESINFPATTATSFTDSSSGLRTDVSYVYKVKVVDAVGTVVVGPQASYKIGS